MRKPDIVPHVLHVSSVVPATPDEAQALLEMAKFARFRHPRNLRVRGAMNYPRRAIMWQRSPTSIKSQVIPASLGLALPGDGSSQGRASLSRENIDRAVAWIERADRGRATGSKDTWNGWWQSLEVARLRNEAGELIQAVH